MDIFKEVEKFHFTRNGYRVNTDRRPENTRHDGSREWLKIGPFSNTVRGHHPIVQEVNRQGIPCNSVCITRRRANSKVPPMGPHRDSRNTGNPPCSYVMHWGQGEREGALVDEHGNRYEEQRVWHCCGDLSKITHWVEPHSSGTRYSMVAFFGPPPRLKRRSSTVPEKCGNIHHDKTSLLYQNREELSRDEHLPQHRTLHT